MKYKLIAFDIDGTLIDTEKTGVLSLIKTIKELMNLDMIYDHAKFYFGIPSSKVADLLGYNDSKKFGEQWEKNFIELSGYIAPFPGVMQMLSTVKNAGYLTAMVTSRSRFEFQYDKYLPSMVPFIDVVICAEDSISHKPNPGPMLKCLKKVSELTGSEIDPKTCLYIGDTEHDSKCAIGAQCDFALMDWKDRGSMGIPAKFIFHNAEEVVEILGCSGR